MERRVTAKIHAGWGQTMGRKLCGAEGDVEQTLDVDKVTCKGCLRKLYLDAATETRRCRETVRRAEEAQWAAALRLMEAEKTA